MTKTKIAVLCLFAVAVLASSLAAIETGEIQGRVRDEGGLALGSLAGAGVDPDAGDARRELDHIHYGPVLDGGLGHLRRGDVIARVGRGLVDERGRGRDHDLFLDLGEFHRNRERGHVAQPDNDVLLNDRGESLQGEGQDRKSVV
jgi:hypothetical protein